MNCLKQTIGAAGFAVLLGIFIFSNAAFATIPAVVMSDHQTLYTTSTDGAYGMAANARGDVFFADFYNNSLDMIPAGSTLPATPTILLTGMNGPEQVTVDKSGNVYVADSLNGKVYRVPFVNGTYQTNTAVTTFNASSGSSSVLCQNTTTADCRLNPITVFTGLRVSGIAVDGSGNYYIAEYYDTTSTGSNVKILKQTPAGVTTSLLTTYLPALTGGYTNGQLASDASGNLYYTDQNNLYSIPVGATSGTIMNSSSLTNPSGVTIDPYTGNLIVSDYGHTPSRIVVIPNESGTLNFNDQYMLAPYQTRSSVGVDGKGTIYYSSANGSASTLSQMQISVYGVPSLAVNASSTTALVYSTFNATSTVLNSYTTSGHGASIGYTSNACTFPTTFTPGQYCSYNIYIKPTHVGPVAGTVMDLDASGNVLAQFTLTANATGSAVAIDPGIATSIGSSSYTKPAGVAVDKAGDVFIADTTANAVYELVGGTGTAVSLGTGLSGPTGVAVDAVGDLFIADTGNSRVVEIPITVGVALSSANQIVVASSLTAPLAIATGPLNSLYIAQSGSLALYENRGYVAPTQTAVISTAYTSPRALAVDPSGDIFIADSVLGDVVELANYTYATSNIATGLTLPTGLVTDADGDLFLVDNGAGTVVRIPNLSGTLTYASAVSMGSFASPYGIGIDEAGNLYLSSQAATPAIYEVARTTGELNFGTQANDVTSSPLTATLVSRGNTALTLGSTVETWSSGDETHFTPSTTCTSSGSLAAGSSCNISATFDPTGPGTDTEVLALSASPTVTTSPFTLTLTGSGTALPATTTTIGTITPGSPTYGQAVTVPVTVTGSSLTGNVTLSVDGTAYGTPQSLTSGATSFNVTGLSAGTHTLSAVYGNDSNNSGSTGTGSVSVAKAVLTVTSNSPTAVTYGATNPTYTASYSGWQYTDTSAVLSGSPSLTTTPATPVNVGSYTITAAAGTLSATNYSFSFVSTGSLTINKATLTVTANSFNIAYGATDPTYTASYSGFQYTDTSSVLSGSPSLTTTPATPSATGSYPITAAIGTLSAANYSFSFVNGTLNIGLGTSTASLSTSLTNVQPGQALTLTATVSGSGAAPTGTVTFTATSTGASQGVLGTASLVNGVATYYGLVWAGTDSITAVYNGDSNYSGSTSNAVTVTNASVTGTLQFNWPGLNWAQGVSYGASTAAWPVTLQNLTGVTVTPTIGIANSNFVISGSTCGTLTQGATCIFYVTFTPTSGGSATGTKITSALTATTSTPAQDASIPVSGIAFSSALTFNWPALNFTPTVAVGATSSPWPVTMTNQSGTATTVNSITVPDASYIISNDNCTGQQLAAFASCMFNVTFSPIAADVTTSGTNILSGTLTASGNSGSVTGSLAVGGWAAAALGFNWPGVNFPNQPIGSTGTNPWPVIVTNYSGSALTGLTYTFTGVSNYQAGAFTLTNTCPSLAPGASCTFDIAPSPVSGQSVGAYSANLVVSGSGLSSTSLPATGSAIEGGYSINWNQNQQGGVSTIDFGPQNTANATAGPWPITVYNNTGFAHTVTITPSLGVFTTDVSSLTIAAGGSALFNLYFTPTADQCYSGTLTISDGTNSYTFNTWGGANK